MAASNYHHKQQNFSNFASPDNNSNPLRRNFQFEDKKTSEDYEKKLQDVLSQLKKKEREPENPFYDNTYKHNMIVARSKQPDISLDFRNQQLPSISRLSDRVPGSVRNDRNEPVQKAESQEVPVVEKRLVNQKSDGSLLRDYDKRNLQNNNNKGGFFDSLGQNSRHKNIVKEYQDYMRSNPIPLPKNKKSIDFDERELDRVSLRKKSEQKQAEKDWYSKDIGVGILPGMGGMLDNRRPAPEPHRRQVTGDYKSPQDKFYDYEPERARRGHSGVYDAQRGPDMGGRGDMQNRMSLDVPASRLAGIGSRIMDSERIPHYDNMRTPQYTPTRDAMNFKFQTPQVDKKSLEMGPNLAGKFREMQGYSNDMDSYTRQGSERREDYEDYREVPRDVRDFQNEGRFQNINRPERKNQRDSDNNANNNANWLEERQKQEQNKKDKQKEELQRAYRDQIEEKKRKKDEEQRRQMAEERKEEERLRKENEELQRQYQLEQQKKREAEEEAVRAKGGEVEDEYTAATNRRLMKKKNKAFEVSAENNMKREVPSVPAVQDYGIENRLRFEDEKLRLEEFGFDQDRQVRQDLARKFEEKLDKKPAYEFSRDPEMEVQREVTKKMNTALDEQLEKMKRDVEYHAKMLRTELTSYKTQAMVSQELRQNAHRELERLRDDLKHQQFQANREPVVSFETHNDQNYMNAGKGQRLDTDRSAEKMNLKLPTKNYAKLYSPDDDGPNLELSASGGLTLDFETKYLPAREGGAVEGSYELFKEPPKFNQIMKKYGIDEEDSSKVKNKNDNAMKKFEIMFPKHGNNNKILVKQDSISAIEDKFSGPLELKGSAGELGHYYPKSTKQVEKPVMKSSRKQIEDDEVEGGDEIERIENLLKKYRDPDIKYREDEKKVVKPVKEGQAVSSKKTINELEHEGVTGPTGYNVGHSAGHGSGQKVIEVEDHKVTNNVHGNEEDEDDYELKDFEMGDDEEMEMGQEKVQINIAHHTGELEDDVMGKGQKGPINVTQHVGELEDE